MSADVRGARTEAIRAASAARRTTRRRLRQQRGGRHWVDGVLRVLALAVLAVGGLVIARQLGIR